jgi:hypothetical protein
MFDGSAHFRSLLPELAVRPEAAIPFHAAELALPISGLRHVLYTH